MRIIPAIDIIDGKCVRLTKGDYSTKKVYADDPLEMAKQFEAIGIRYLHLVDLDGAESKDTKNLTVLERIASKTALNIDFGGGVKSTETLKSVFNAGAKQVTAGSIAAKNPELVLQWLDEFGAEKIILGADARNGQIAVNGWKEEAGISVEAFLKRFKVSNDNYVICTSISRDGMLSGPDIDLYKDLLVKFEMKLIASGGVSSVQDLLELKKAGLEGAIVGKAIYEGKIELNELESINR